MYLKNLTILGFKSFADKTSLDFQDGVTAIVGPNGCGKSNVADAIRWVLGEQSAKALRGGAMHDVIFSGTDRRKALQMAEVSLTLDDVTEHQLQAAGLELGYSEVTISRRVYRDGGSEYFINRTQCRLKDIQQLFMGTGIGRTSYSIMAQGNITQILSSKPDDRRIIFEEAAGITRYKAQKKEALRKLEHTEQNLVRVEDLIGEVKRRIGTLQRQAGKAKRYKEIMDALRTLDTQLSRHKLDVLEQEKKQLEDEAADHLEIKATKEVEYKKMEAEVDAMREEFSRIESESSDARQSMTSLKAELEQNQQRIAFHEQRILELDEQNQQAAHESIEADERLKAARSELERASAGMGNTEQELEKQRVELQKKNEAMHEVERRLSAVQEKINEFQAKAYTTAQELAQLSNQINQFDLQKQGDVARLEKLHSEKRQRDEEFQRNNALLESESGQLAAMQTEIEEVDREISSARERLEEKKQGLSEINSRAEDLDRKLTHSRSRLHVLEQLDRDHEGLTGGAQKVNEFLGSSSHGLLIDHIQVEDKYIKAVEAVLKNRFEMILPGSRGDMSRVSDFLKSGKIGDISLGFKDLINGGRESNQSLQSLTEVIECDSEVAEVIGVLCSAYCIAGTLDEALNAYSAQNYGSGACGFVTLHGDVIHPDGVIDLSGTEEGNQANYSSALARKNEITNLSSEIKNIEVEVVKVTEVRESLKSEVAGIEESLQESRDASRSLEIEKAGLVARIRSVESILANLTEKQDVTEFEIEKLEESRESETTERTDLEKRRAELENEGESIRVEMGEQNKSLEAIRHERDAAGAELTEAKVLVASKEEIMRGFTNQINPLKTRIEELGSLMEQRGRDQQSFAEKKEVSLQTIEQARQSISELQHQVESAQVEIQKIEEEKLSVGQKIKEEEQILREHRELISKIQSELTRFEVELTERNLYIESLLERIQDKYQLDLREVPTECITITLADSGPPAIHKLTPEEMEETGAAQDWKLIEEQVNDLQGNVDSMGPVNLVAIEEYEETEERYNFLNNQHRDLTEAKDKLMEAVNRINTETREMFMTTFAKIRENFQSTFEEIFGGGKADLILVDEEDVLESGIDIVARPPGKKLQSISLLSGGEQTMTAVSLLFAIYQVKPSPFCVLDELDAPLDESNINRFLKVLRRFVSESQFLIITHSKRTISMADTLYGVTMQERGVSKIISVRFKDSDKGANAPENMLDDALKGAIA